jgi:hypothetical protein
MSKYVAYVGKVRFTLDDPQQLGAILKRDRDRKAQAKRKRREHAVRKEVREFRDRYQDCVFRYGNTVGLLCTSCVKQQ